MLLPQSNESRQTLSLDGLWKFQNDPEASGLENGWANAFPNDAIERPVPCSLNELTSDAAAANYHGIMWYTRDCFPPAEWSGRRVRLRVGAAAHEVTAFCNGIEVGRHRGGFLPADFDLSRVLRPGERNKITLRLNSRLSWETLPPGVTETEGDFPDSGSHPRQKYFHDFFNFSGIHRSVQLYATAPEAITSIRTTPFRSEKETGISYSIETTDRNEAIQLRLFDAEGQCVADAKGATGRLTVENPTLWQPGKPYLYTIEATHSASGDCYRLQTGIRFVEIRGKEIRINDKPFYFRGFGKHEDADIIGKAHSDAVMVRDFELLHWIGANSFRTSHYPYAEEVYDYADRQGIVLIGELPAVGFNFAPKYAPFFVDGQVDAKTQAHHFQTLEEMIARDANHPSVVCWSLANEASTQEPASRAYFEPIVKRARELDDSRPLMLVMSAFSEKDHVGDLFDILGLNRYYGWYHDVGELDTITPNLTAELTAWWKRYGKPIVMTEYGADAIAGLHRDPPAMFSEEFQCAYLERVHEALDKLDFVCGEHVWNFADFATAEGLKRVGGNCKGVFTRQRQPKMAAHLLRQRWQGSES